MPGAFASAVGLGVAWAALGAPWIPEALRTLGASSAASRAGLALASAWAGPPVLLAIVDLERRVRRRSPGLRALALGAGVFAVERGLAASGWGAPWSGLGHSQRGALGVAQLALVGGVPLVSAGLAAINVALADAAAGRPGAARLAAAGAAGWLALVLAGLPVAEALRPSAGAAARFDLLLLQPDLPRGDRWPEALQPLNLERVRRFAARALAEERAPVDALVLPENLLTAPVDRSPALAAALDVWLRELGRPVLTGLVLASPSGDRRRYRSALVWLEPGRGITARLDKERAVPLLESGRRFPGRALLARALGGAARGRKVEEARDAAPFAGPIPVTPALCYELLFPDLVARRRTPGSVAIVSPADDSWLEDRAATRTLAGFARFRAIEQRLALVRVAHGGLSLAIDPFGRPLAALPEGTWAARRVSLVATPPPTARERAAIAALPLLAGALGGWLGTIAGPANRSSPR